MGAHGDGLILNPGGIVIPGAYATDERDCHVVRVCLVDEYPLFREGLRAALSDSSLIQVVAEADSPGEAAALFYDLDPPPDVALVGLRMADKTSVTLAQTFVAARGHTGSSPRVIILAAVDDDYLAIEAISSGALGYLLMGLSREELIRAISIVAVGGAVFSPSIAARLANYFTHIRDAPARIAFPELTERERQVLELIAQGQLNRQIARKLVLSEKTVRNHITHVFMKLQVTTRTEASLRAREAGLGAEAG